MQWLLLCLCAFAAAAQELRCVSPGCAQRPRDREWQSFAINGSSLTISIEKRLYLRCHGYPALESPALPRFTSEYYTSKVHIYDCPLPNNGSIGAVLAAMNVVLQPENGYTSLCLFGTSDTEEFETHHFSGLEKVTNLTIQPMSRMEKVGSRAFTELINLRSLELHGTEIEAEELYHLPRSLVSLELAGVSMKPLTGSLLVALGKASRAIPQLRTLSLYTFDNIKYVSISSNETELQENQKVDSSLEEVTLKNWLEHRLPALERCGRLRKFESISSSVEEVPDRFVAACPNLEELVFNYAKDLKTLPAKFLEGATALKSLTIMDTGLETLPAGLFQDTTNLIRLDLTNNLLKELPSAVFASLPLEYLSLSDNQLYEVALNELATLTSLTELKIRRNNFQYPCEEFGYSPFQNLTKLKLLDLSSSSVKRICRDWRENLKYLEHLDLYDAGIWDINYSDLQYTRDPSVKNAVVSLRQLVGIIFSESDYKKALTAPASPVLVKFENREKVWRPPPGFPQYSFPSFPLLLPTCDCAMYWFRKAMDDASQAVRTVGYTCSNGKLLKDMKTEEFCPESERV